MRRLQCTGVGWTRRDVCVGVSDARLVLGKAEAGVSCRSRLVGGRVPRNRRLEENVNLFIRAPESKKGAGDSDLICRALRRLPTGRL